jgi:integrase
MIEKFCRVVSTEAASTGKTYGLCLNDFHEFLIQKYNMPLDSFIGAVKKEEYDIYEILKEYHIRLKAQGLQRSTIGNRIHAAKIFLEYYGIPISSTVFRLKVRAPTRRLVELEALSKDVVRKIILACQDTRLQTYVLLLAATGTRANEALSVRAKDIDWESGKIILRAEYTKTKQERYVFLTKECLKQLQLWKDYRERERRIVRYVKGRIGRTNVITTVVRKLEPTELFFTSGRHYDVTNPIDIYHFLSQQFSKVLDRIGLSERHENKGRRHKITLHSFRRFVKTIISNLGYQDFSEWFIGHSHSTYWRQSEEDKLKLFHKIESSLTYLDYATLEKKGATTDDKLEQKEQQIQAMKDQVKLLATKLDRVVTFLAETSATTGMAGSSFKDKNEFVEYHKNYILKSANWEIHNTKFEKMKVENE